MTQMSKEYATALFALAKENNSEDEILSALKYVSDAFHANPEYMEFLSSPSIQKNEKLDAIKEAFSKVLPEYVMSFVLLLCERQRIMAFDECLKEYEALYNFSKKIAEAHITSAVELTEQEKEKLKEKLEKISKKKLILKYTVDKSVMGGIIAEVDGKIIDGSLKHRLSEIKEVIKA